MAQFATPTDLTALVPDSVNWGVTDFNPQLILASNDVLERLRAEWWPQAVSARAHQSVDAGLAPPELDEAKLNTPRLAHVTVYKALERYILPAMTQDSTVDGDAFNRKETRYRSFYANEWDSVIKQPIYDFSSDASFTNIDRRVTGRRLRRA